MAVAACASQSPKPRRWRLEFPSTLLGDESAIPELTASMVDLIAAAVACDVTRVATLQFGYGGAKWMFDWEGSHRDAHQDLAHRDTEDDEADPAVTALLVRVHSWYATQIARRVPSSTPSAPARARCSTTRSSFGRASSGAETIASITCPLIRLVRSGFVARVAVRFGTVNAEVRSLRLERLFRPQKAPRSTSYSSRARSNPRFGFVTNRRTTRAVRRLTARPHCFSYTPFTMSPPEAR